MVTLRTAVVAFALSGAALADKLPKEDVESAGPRVLHVPVAWAAADEPLEVAVEVTQPHLVARITLHYRRQGEKDFHSAHFARSVQGWQATVPAADLAPGTVEYYIGSHVTTAPAAPEHYHFGTPDAPHPFLVIGDDETRIRKELLAGELGNRSRFRARGEIAHFGRRTLDDGTGASIDDYYWRTEVDYTYRILGPIYAIRIGLGILRGETYHIDNGGRMRVPRVGLYYGDAEVRFRLGAYVRLDVSAIFGVGPDNFDGGGGAQLTIGNDPGTHLALGGDYVTDVGGRGWLRLAWNTIPRVPMALTLELTNLPSLNGASGRVYFSATLRAGRHLAFDAQIGYATRDNGIGGPTAGLAASLEF
jgi:hypothetical protein